MSRELSALAKHCRRMATDAKYRTKAGATQPMTPREHDLWLQLADELERFDLTNGADS